jgi:sterol 3beta-glucosyltransferase
VIYLASVSSIKDVKPAESKHPRHLNIIFDSNDGIVESIVEFDTDESAQDWRRELLGAFHPSEVMYSNATK